MNKTNFSFESLDVWQKSRGLVSDVYRLMRLFPSYEQYALCNQIRRSVLSVPSNIAEGSGRDSLKEKIHFIEIAFGSLMEVYCQLLIAADLGYILPEDFSTLSAEIVSIAKMLTRLRSSFKKKLSPPLTSNPLTH